MVDIHNHILYGIDDGCKTIEESLQALIQAEKLGITAIVLTPHYVKGSKYNCNNKNKRKLLKELQELVKEKNINIDLYLGNEIYFENDMLSLILNKEATTINNSRYLLFELPMASEVNNLKEIIFSLRAKRVKPIIAHPERYNTFQEDPNQLLDLIRQGCLFQCNTGSLTGIYGKEACKCVKLLLEHNMVHFMATDTHHPNGKNYEHLNDAISELKSIVGEDYANELLVTNPLKAIQDEDIKVREAKEIKKKLFFF